MKLAQYVARMGYKRRKCIRGLVRKPGGTTLEYLFLCGRTFKQVGRVGTGFILVRVGTNGGLL